MALKSLREKRSFERLISCYVSMSSTISRVMKNIIKIFTFTLIFVIASCSAENRVEIRQKAWDKEIKALNPSIKTIEELLSEIKKLGVVSEPFYDKYELAVVLETIESVSIACDKWLILLSAKASDKGKVSEYTVSSAGNCL